MTEEFDFVVVGGGSGGCAVASRLSEDPATSVALLEVTGALGVKLLLHSKLTSEIERGNAAAGLAAAGLGRSRAGMAKGSSRGVMRGLYHGASHENKRRYYSSRLPA